LSLKKRVPNRSCAAHGKVRPTNQRDRTRFRDFAGGYAFLRGMRLNEVIFLVIAMAVSAIPEGLQWQ
jgi:hypothetical protein